MNDTASRSAPERHARVVLGATGIVHLALLSYFLPKGILFSGAPIHEYDYALHAYQVDRAATALRQSGHFWSYDPFVLAGQPANVVEDATNRMLELFVIAATHAGANRWTAFNLYVLLVHVSVPFAAWAAARLFGSSRLSSALTASFWVLLWHFDSFLHWCWYIGMIAWGAASMLAVLVVGLMYRALRDRRRRHYAGLAALAAFTTLLHPFSVLTLVAPLGALYRRAFARLSRAEHGWLVFGTALAASTALVWAGPIIHFRRSFSDVDAFLWPTLRYVLLDWFDFLSDALMTGEPVRTAFRVLAFVMAGVAFVRLRRENDDRVLPLATLVLVSVALAYLSGYSNVLRQTQPYRNVGPAALAAALAAATELPNLFAGSAPPGRSRDARAVFVLGAAAVVPGLLKTCLGYMPTLVPDRFIPRSALRQGPLPGVSNDEYPPIVHGYSRAPPEYEAIARHLDATLGQRGRVVVYHWVLGEYLATFSSVPVIGGIPQRNVPQALSHPLRYDFRPAREGEDPVRRYLEKYAVGAVVTTGERTPIEERVDLLELDRTFGDHRVYRVRAEPSYFERGSGSIVRQALNVVSVRNAAGPEVVLRFHFWETLRCKPDCRLERADVDRDPAGFIRIRNPPPAFDIENRYGDP